MRAAVGDPGNARRPIEVMRYVLIKSWFVEIVVDQRLHRLCLYGQEESDEN